MSEAKKDESPVVKVGQVWEDWDSRFRDSQQRRLISIERIDGAYAYCSGLSTGKKTRVRVDRFRPTASGYRLVSEAEKDNSK
jgi:hypothetical protein